MMDIELPGHRGHPADGTIEVANAFGAARSRAQLERTALQFPSVKRVTISLNGEALESALRKAIRQQ